MAVPHAARLCDLIEHWAAARPDDVAYMVLEDGDNVSARMTYAELGNAVQRFADALSVHADAGDRLLLLHRPGLDFLTAFFGATHAGLIVVPAYPPERFKVEADLERIARIAADCEASIILCDVETNTFREEAGRRHPALAKARWMTRAHLDAGPGKRRRTAGTARADLAMLQYTSGSVGAPKGVMLTHGNLLANQESIRESMAIRDGAVIVSWLPLYHDMGLIGMVLQPLYVGGTCILMSPHRFIQRPSRWLSAITKFKADVSGGPNFAFELCLRRIADDALAELELSTWKVAFCGSEPIRPSVMRRFAQRFATCGFDARALLPCYGLAEASLLVTGARPQRGANIVAVSSSALVAGRARPASGLEDETLLVSSGYPPSNQRLKIVEGPSLAVLPDQLQGEICVCGPNVAQGYWRADESTAAAFVEDEHGRWLRTGDTGFTQNGELFVLGRIKEAVKIRGRNLIPQDIERSVQRTSPLFRSQCGAAFGIDNGEEELLVVVQEIARVGRQCLQEAADAATRAVTAEHQVNVHEFVLIEPHGLPKTRNGKISRVSCRSSYLTETLPIVARYPQRQRAVEARIDDGS